MNPLSRPRRTKPLVFGAPSIHEAEIQEVVDSMRSGWLGSGPKVLEFERYFAEYKRTGSCVAVSSCTAALHLSLLAVGLSPGDEVITTPLTFCATVNAILHAGGVPVLADVDPMTMNIDAGQIEELVTSRSKAIVVVHFAGRPCAMDAITEVATKHGLKVVEDCAHAIETTYHGQPAGTMGDYGCFSFYATKNVTTAEGGMICCRNADEADRFRQLALHGLSQDAWKRYHDVGYKHYLVTQLGFKYNMTDLQAAIGLHQLARIEDNWLHRQHIWTRYQNELAALPLVLPSEVPDGQRHAYHLFTCLVDEPRTGISRDQFLQRMHDEKIGVGVHYVSLAQQPYYQERMGWQPEMWPNAHRIGLQTVSLPLSAALSDDDVSDVISSIHRVVK